VITTVINAVGDKPFKKFERVGSSFKVRVGTQWAWPGMKLRTTPFQFDNKSQALSLAELMKADELIETRYRYMNA
jgi:hypothetical protein